RVPGAVSRDRAHDPAVVPHHGADLRGGVRELGDRAVATEAEDRAMARRIARREVLGLCATAAGAAGAAGCLAPRFPARGKPLAARAANVLGPAAAGAATTPACTVRPEQTEGPYFVDERLQRSDIRSDPSDGTVKDGAKLTLTFVLGRI